VKADKATKYSLGNTLTIEQAASRVVAFVPFVYRWPSAYVSSTVDTRRL